MQDDLIGFVVGALDVVEHQEIRQKIERDPRLQEQIQRIERCLHPLCRARESVPPPSGLAERTCRQVAVLTGADCESGLGRMVDSATDPAARLGTKTPSRPGGDFVSDQDREPTPISPAAAGTHSAQWGSNCLDSAPSQLSWTRADFFVAAGVCLAVACLFFPAIANSRHHAQLAACQNNMRQLGTAMLQFSQEQGGYFPVVPARGNYAAAGFYAPMLVEKGLINDGRVFLCPAKGSTVALQMPSLHEIAQAQGPKLVRIHHTMGGDYAYSIGFVENGRLQGIRNEGRKQYAILADAPFDKTRNATIGTHGRGQNVLFQDGGVRFVATRSRPGHPDDDLFQNDLGKVRAGLGREDCVLAPSYVSPLAENDAESNDVEVIR